MISPKELSNSSNFPTTKSPHVESLFINANSTVFNKQIEENLNAFGGYSNFES
jgi:hypothetical protein